MTSPITFALVRVVRSLHSVRFRGLIRKVFSIFVRAPSERKVTVQSHATGGSFLTPPSTRRNHSFPVINKPTRQISDIFTTSNSFGIGTKVFRSVKTVKRRSVLEWIVICLSWVKFVNRRRIRNISRTSKRSRRSGRTPEDLWRHSCLGNLWWLSIDQSRRESARLLSQGETSLHRREQFDHHRSGQHGFGQI